MATATKTVRTLQASASNSAAATTNSSTWDLSTALGGTVEARITNGGTGPTIGCDVAVQISYDGGTTWRDFSRQTAGLTNSLTYDFIIDLPPPVKTARVQFTGNTGQAVTIEAFGHELTSIA